MVLGGASLTLHAETAVEDNRWIVESWPKALEDAYWRDPKVMREERPATGAPRVFPKHRREPEAPLPLQHLLQALSGLHYSR